MKTILDRKRTQDKRAIPYKQWVQEEANREGKTLTCIYMRVRRGYYPWLPINRINDRVVLINAEALYDWMGLGAFVEEMAGEGGVPPPP